MTEFSDFRIFGGANPILFLVINLGSLKREFLFDMMYFHCTQIRFLALYHDRVTDSIYRSVASISFRSAAYGSVDSYHDCQLLLLSVATSKTASSAEDCIGFPFDFANSYA